MARYFRLLCRASSRIILIGRVLLALLSFEHYFLADANNGSGLTEQVFDDIEFCGFVWEVQRVQLFCGGA